MDQFYSPVLSRMRLSYAATYDSRIEVQEAAALPIRWQIFLGPLEQGRQGKGKIGQGRGKKAARRVQMGWIWW